MPADIRRLAYLVIEACDLDAWARFAETVLCAEIAAGSSAETLLLRIDDRPFRIAIARGSRDDVCTLGFEVDDKPSFDRIREALQAAGHAVRDGDRTLRDERGVAELLSVADPAGLALEISYGAMARPQAPFRPPRPHAGFVTGDQGIGHVMLSVPDVAAMQAFYEGVLGFRISDYVATNYNGRDARFVFMRCNARHHTMALGNLPLPKRLLHFMLQCRDLDDVGAALDLVPASGLRQTRSFGRHINDKMLSFYMETPSKVQVEYGFGAIEVGADESWAVTTYDVTSRWGHRHL